MCVLYTREHASIVDVGIPCSGPFPNSKSHKDGFTTTKAVSESSCRIGHHARETGIRIGEGDIIPELVIIVLIVLMPVL